MRVLYFINAGIMGGRERHVHTLVRSLPPAIEALVCAVSGGEATEAMKHDGLNVHVLGGRNGHDPRIFFRIIHLLRSFKPDIIHAHCSAFIPSASFRLFPDIPLIMSLHGPAAPTLPAGRARRPLRAAITKLLSTLPRRPDYYLPVSRATWNEFLRYYPSAKGEVFYNALNLTGLPSAAREGTSSTDMRSTGKKIIGMVGRMADVKDWPSFVRISAAAMVKDPAVEAWSIGDGPVRSTCEALWRDLARQNQLDPNRLKWLGSRQDARELMTQMSAILITSHSEQLPTTLLEAFAIGVPVVGFLPEGGTREVLALSKSPCAILRADRDVDATATDVLRVLGDSTLRDNLIAEGYRIVHEHFDMQKLCATQLVKIYQKVIKAKAK